VRAFVVTEADDTLTIEVQDIEATPRDPSDLLIAVDYSGVNFKDAMVAALRVEFGACPLSLVASTPPAPSCTRPIRRCPKGLESWSTAVSWGWPVTGLRAVHLLPARYVTALPESVSTRVAMIVGTAGFTALESLMALEDHGLEKGSEVLVTGATGGVGSLAVAFLAAKGYLPVASTGSAKESQWLIDRGARRVIGRDDVADNPGESWLPRRGPAPSTAWAARHWPKYFAHCATARPSRPADSWRVPSW